jgi:hypothetical protein
MSGRNDTVGRLSNTELTSQARRCQNRLEQISSSRVGGHTKQESSHEAFWRPQK